MTISKDLTPRELEALRLAADGLSSAQIAAKMGIGKTTVAAHLLSAFAKLDANGRTNAVHIAHLRGILPHAAPEVVDFFASDVEVK